MENIDSEKWSQKQISTKIIKDDRNSKNSGTSLFRIRSSRSQSPKNFNKENQFQKSSQQNSNQQILQQKNSQKLPSINNKISSRSLERKGNQISIQNQQQISIKNTQNSLNSQNNSVKKVMVSSKQLIKIQGNNSSSQKSRSLEKGGNQKSPDSKINFNQVKKNKENMDETIEKFQKNSKLQKSNSKSPNKSPDIKKKNKETKRKKKDDEKSRQNRLLKQQRMEEEEKQKKQELLYKQQQEQMLMKKDLDRLKQEIPEIQDQEQYYHARFESMQDRVRQKQSWEHFMKCDGKPKLNSQQDLNAYYFNFKQNLKLENFQNDWTGYLNKIQMVLELIQQVKIQKLNKSSQMFQKFDIIWYYKYQKDLMNAVVEKIHKMQVDLVGQADQYYERKKQQLAKMDIDIQNLLKSTSNEERQKIEIFSEFKPLNDLKFGYWINPVGKTGYRVKPIDFASINIQAEVPRTYNSNRLIMTAMWCSYDYISILYGNQLDYQPFYVVGGVLNIEIFEYPTLPRIENKWKMKYRKDEYEDIKKLYYPNQEGQGSYNYNNTTPIKIYFQVPSDLFINRDSLKIATFDQQSGWQMDHINEIKFLDKEQKLLSFSSNKLAPFAIVNQRIEDFPYKSWKIKRYKENTSIFTLNGRRINLIFEIGAGYVKIIEDHTLDLDEQERFNKYFKDICGVQMTPGEMLYRLQQIGINYLPKDQDSQYAILEPKNYELEQFVNVEVAKASSQFQIKCSNWNEDCGQDKVITLIKPIQDYEIDENEETDIDQMSIMWQQNKCSILKLKETDSQLDFALAGKTLAHSNLLLTLQKNETKGNYYNKEVQDKNQMLYWNTMQQFLSLTRVFSFTFSKQ